MTYAQYMRFKEPSDFKFQLTSKHPKTMDREQNNMKNAKYTIPYEATAVDKAQVYYLINGFVSDLRKLEKYYKKRSHMALRNEDQISGSEFRGHARSLREVERVFLRNLVLCDLDNPIHDLGIL